MNLSNGLRIMKKFYGVLAFGLLAASSVGAMESVEKPLTEQPSNGGGGIVYKTLSQGGDVQGLSFFEKDSVYKNGSLLKEKQTIYSSTREQGSPVISGFNPSTEMAFLGVLDPDLLSKFNTSQAQGNCILEKFTINLKSLLETDPSQVQLHFYNFQEKDKNHQEMLSFVKGLGALEISFYQEEHPGETIAISPEGKFYSTYKSVLLQKRKEWLQKKKEWLESTKYKQLSKEAKKQKFQRYKNLYLQLKDPRRKNNREAIFKAVRDLDACYRKLKPQNLAFDYLNFLEPYFPNTKYKKKITHLYNKYFNEEILSLMKEEISNSISTSFKAQKADSNLYPSLRSEVLQHLTLTPEGKATVWKYLLGEEQNVGTTQELKERLQASFFPNLKALTVMGENKP